MSLKTFSTDWLTRLKTLLGLNAYESKAFTANGYQILPSGLIIQWGTAPNANASDVLQVVTFPIPFPNACLNVTATPVSPTQSGTDAGVTVSVITTTTFTATLGHAGGTWRPMWFAIGY